MTFDSKMTFEKQFRLVSRAASQRLSYECPDGDLRWGHTVLNSAKKISEDMPGFCQDVSNIAWFCLGGMLMHKLQATGGQKWRGPTPCTVNWALNSFILSPD